VRHAVADWTPYQLKKAPEGAPNVPFVLYDDTGLAAWSPYGGRVNMPTLVVSDDGTAMEGTDNWTWTDGVESCSGSDSLSASRI